MDVLVGGRAVEAAEEEEGDVGGARVVAEERLDGDAEAPGEGEGGHRLRNGVGEGTHHPEGKERGWSSRLARTCRPGRRRGSCLCVKQGGAQFTSARSGSSMQALAGVNQAHSSPRRRPSSANQAGES